MLLIINLGIILSLLIIVLFNIINLKRQVLTSLIVLTILFLFKIIFGKMIKNNKRNDEVKDFSLQTERVTEKVTPSSDSKCVYRYDKVDSKNSFDLKNLDTVVTDLKKIIEEDRKNDESDCIRLDPKGKKFVFCQDSGNHDFHYVDLHNKEIKARLNVSDEESLLLNNVDCTNDTSCIIQPSIYNFHKH